MVKVQKNFYNPSKVQKFGRQNIKNNSEILVKLKKRKVFILIPDGVGIRNFVYSSFPDDVANEGLDLVVWNLTAADISAMGFSEIKITGKPRVITDLYKRAKIEAELNHFTKKFKDPVFQSYKFPSTGGGPKKRVKNAIVSSLVNSHSNKNGVIRLQERMEKAERKSAYYKNCFQILRKENPEVLFCSNQRAINTLAPILAARDLGIPTACFIFSWDNLPKGTKVLDTDYYFVWSLHMKQELTTYYPWIDQARIMVTGTPQFQVHFDMKLRIEESEFYSRYNLKKGRRYLCFSGDDITTSPVDQVYLRDVARAVLELNENGLNIGIIFRRAPVDFSDRYDEVLNEFKDIVVPIVPAWKNVGEYWNEMIPEKYDNILQTNIINNTFMVINLGSSMVFDYVSYKKPCAFINYDPEGEEILKDVSVIYNYVHFRSMPDNNAVLWINSKEEIKKSIIRVLEGEITSTVGLAEKWFGIINESPVKNATFRIAETLREIAEKNE
jgi:hypothetical protein